MSDKELNFNELNVEVFMDYCGRVLRTTQEILRACSTQPSNAQWNSYTLLLYCENNR